MHFFASLTTLLAVGAGMATAIPTAINEAGLAARDVDILTKCKDAGIDVYGPIPKDYDSYDPKSKGYHFNAGSKAALWAAAQAYTNDSEHEKRQGPANIGIGMWAQDGCAGQGSWFDDVTYNVNSYATTNYYSVLIKYRGLRSNEHLDFSRLSGNDWCGKYLYSAGQVSYNSKAP